MSFKMLYDLITETTFGESQNHKLIQVAELKQKWSQLRWNLNMYKYVWKQKCAFLKKPFVVVALSVIKSRPGLTVVIVCHDVSYNSGLSPQMTSVLPVILSEVD